MENDRIRQSDLPDVLALAFLGDAIFSHAVRSMLVARGIFDPGRLSHLTLAYVTAAAQSEGFGLIEADLDEDERSVARRARNSNHLNRPRGVPAADYRRATALEALLGMLEVTERTERLKKILDRLLDSLSHREADLP